MANRMSNPQAPPSASGRVWSYVSRSPLNSIWNLEGVPPKVILKNTWNAMFDDNLLGRSAELGFYFLFALFPTLFTACAVLGLAARSAAHIYEHLLAVPVDCGSSFRIGHGSGSVQSNHSRRKQRQDNLRAGSRIVVCFRRVFRNSRHPECGLPGQGDPPLLESQAVGDRHHVSSLYRRHTHAGVAAAGRLLRPPRSPSYLPSLAGCPGRRHLSRTTGWLVATAFLSLLFALIYYFGPDVKVSHWRWLTPGSAFGMLGWLVARSGLRVYVHYFNNYSATYGSLGQSSSAHLVLSERSDAAAGRRNQQRNRGRRHAKRNWPRREALKPEIVAPRRRVRLSHPKLYRTRHQTASPAFLHLRGRWRGLGCFWDIFGVTAQSKLLQG